MASMFQSRVTFCGINNTRSLLWRKQRYNSCLMISLSNQHDFDCVCSVFTSFKLVKKNVKASFMGLGFKGLLPLLSSLMIYQSYKSIHNTIVPHSNVTGAISYGQYWKFSPWKQFIGLFKFLKILIWIFNFKQLLLIRTESYTRKRI